MTYTCLSGNQVQNGTGAYSNNVIPPSVRPYLMLPDPTTPPFDINIITGEVSISTVMAPFTPIDYASGPHQYVLRILVRDSSVLNLIPEHTELYLNITINIIEVM